MTQYLLSPDEITAGSDVRKKIKLSALRIYNRQFGLFSFNQCAMLSLFVWAGYQKLGAVYVVTFLTMAFFASLYWVLPRLEQAFDVAAAMEEFMTKMADMGQAIGYRISADREIIDLDLVFLDKNGELLTVETRANQDGTKYIHREHNQYSIRRSLGRVFGEQWKRAAEALDRTEIDDRQAA